MAYMLGSLFGAILITGLMTRLAMVALKKMGDGPSRIVAATVLAYVVAIALAGWGGADGGPWNPRSSWFFYAVGCLIWMALDFRGLANRRSARRRPTPVSLP